jgi:glycerol-3-phosphate O-acyltransferase
MDEEERVEALRKIVRDMGEDIAGNFDPRVYALATRVIPGLLTAIMSPSSLPQQLMAGFSQLDTLITVGGADREAAAAGEGRHAGAGADALVEPRLGGAGLRADAREAAAGGLRGGQEPVLEPADQLLHAQPRGVPGRPRIQAQLYKEVLKTYSCMMIERGYHSLFFPGGTRSRSGLVERRLKLGLAGTGSRRSPATRRGGCRGRCTSCRRR